MSNLHIVLANLGFVISESESAKWQEYPEKSHLYDIVNFVLYTAEREFPPEEGEEQKIAVSLKPPNFFSVQLLTK